MADSKSAAARLSAIARMNEAWAQAREAQRNQDPAAGRAALDRFAAVQDEYMAFNVRGPETGSATAPGQVARPPTTAEPVSPSTFLAALQRLRVAFVERDGRPYAPTREERDDLAVVGTYCHRRGLSLSEILRKVLAPVGGAG